MARRAIATAKSYGYKGGLWEEGQIIELEVGEKVPEYFRLLGSQEEVEQKKPDPEPVTLSAQANQELIDEAIDRGIKDAKILNQDELLKVLAKDTTKKEIEAIVKSAKGRQKKK